MTMKKITKDELDVFLRKHKLWLENDPEGERANLSDANLSSADLRCADLRCADLRCANLSDADLRCANLSSANLSSANLSDANLSSANLSDADLSDANLSSANLSDADLSDANPENAKNVNYPIVCPEEGSFIGFKKVRNNYIVKLEIQADAMRSSASSRKCRCSKAKVISITDFDGMPADVEVVYSLYDREFAYRVGETIEVKDFDPNRWHECAPGIHFFITRTEAMNYRF